MCGEDNKENNMGDKSSGVYIIDEAYNIISYNAVAKELYPQLKKGEKCYTCLMGLDAPCPICPVLRGVKGPQTYFDPIRKIYESVDAVELSEDARYALVFTTVGERERLSKKLPSSEEELNALYERAYYDGLTGGYSREGFIREAEAIFAGAQQEEYAILLFNIKNFKAFNELFGVEGGDMLLCQFYNDLKSSDLHPLLTARLEADRMVCLVKRADVKPETLEKLLDKKWNIFNRMIRLHSKCGIYYVDNTDLPVSSMIDRASMAKQSIVDEYIQQYAIYDVGLRKNYVNQAEILVDFQNSIIRDEFKVYYQPVVDTMTGQIVSAEALIRWAHPGNGLLSPATFISVLERNGQITKLDWYVIEHVYHYLTRRQDTGKFFVPVSVNLSWQDFYDTALLSRIMSRLRDGALPKGTINYEVTETLFTALEKNYMEELSQFRTDGARILLDDFGSGYSTFGMIGSYDFDFLKIDKSFIWQLDTSEKVRRIVASIITMSHQIGLRTVAEGVENQVELDFLRSCGCDYIQGYYFSRPLPEEEFDRYLDERSIALSGEAVISAQRARIAGETENIIARTKHTAMAENNQMMLMEKLLDGMDSFIQVCDPENFSMLYANQMTRQIAQHPEMDYRGEKCYQYMLGLDSQCAHCPIHQMGDELEKKIEVDDGAHTFELTARFIDLGGKKVFVECGRDITATKRRQERYDSQIKSILQSIPEEQGIFYVDVTADRWLSSSGNAQNARDMQDIESVDALVRRIASFVPDQAGQERFFAAFCRTALQDAFAGGHHEVQLETLSYYDDHSIRPSRIKAILFQNPDSDHLESIIYGVDISEESKEGVNIQTELTKIKSEFEQEVQEVQKKYAEADHDRRVDFLTGLHNRRDLFQTLQASLAGTAPEIQSMYMVDIDNFKVLNDQYGHLAGDDCLREIGGRLKDYGKKNNIMFYRYGGEEFLGIGFAGEKKAGTIAEEMLQMIRGLKIVSKDRAICPVTASIGYTENNRRYEKMIDFADMAMYKAKEAGKNQVVCFELL